MCLEFECGKREENILDIMAEISPTFQTYKLLETSRRGQPSSSRKRKMERRKLWILAWRVNAEGC